MCWMPGHPKPQNAVIDYVGVDLQVNEAQMQFGGTAAGSRYSFKPAALRAVPLVPGGSLGIPAGPSR